ncbi:MAG TPA: hypothetical protein PLW86_14350 [Rhodocyclaceae bacterium]|nr:hypothetical protein [Rhodocyclaceae bacterium]
MPKTQVIWDKLLAAGFRAWYIEVEERLNAVPDTVKAEELANLQELCREDVCNFQFANSSSVDRWRSPALESIRQRLGEEGKQEKSARTDVLLSSHLQSNNFSLARQLAAVTRSRTIEALRLERQRFENLAPITRDLPSMMAFAASRIKDVAIGHGFSLGPLLDGVIETRRPAGRSSELVARLGELPSVGRSARLSGITFEASIDVSQSQRGVSTSKEPQLLPLRATAIAPGISCYLDWGLVSGAGKRGDSSYVLYEPYVAGLQSSVDPFIYVALAVDCVFTIIKLVEDPLHQALMNVGL